MNEPRQPKDPPTHGGVNPVSDPTENSKTGIPEGMENVEATGTPDSGRQKTETTPND